MPGDIPTRVLSEALQEAMRGRSVKAAVFTTFTFDPGFFEEEVLPLLFEQSFSHVPKLRLVQLEEALRDVEHVAVYYDRKGLVPGGSPATLDVRRIPLSRPTGYFHPKIIMLLVEDQEEGETRTSLILVVTSANLTLAGWWENVECAHVREVAEGSRCSFRQDLLGLMKSIRADEGTGDEHAALNEIRKFVRDRLDNETYRSAQGILHPRLYTGQQPLPQFLKETLRLPTESYNLEVISPYFDDSDAGALRELIKALAPKETRIFLPRADDDSALCHETYFNAVSAIPNTSWARLPRPVVQRARSDEDKQPDRFVHAKVYRLWSRAQTREYILLGSVNLTGAAHSKAGAGNLETAVLLDMRSGRNPQFWLEVVEDAPSSFCEIEAEESAQETMPPPLTVRHLWDRNRTEYFWEDVGAPPAFATLSSAGSLVERLEPVVTNKWTALAEEASSRVAEILPGTSFLEVSVEGGEQSLILVREEGMAHKPSLLFSLTAEEILRYWSLLSPEQREAFLSDKARPLFVAEGLVAPGKSPPASPDSMFDRFAGIFHAFARLDEHVRRAIEAGHVKEAEYRLFGRKYDSLPSLLDKVINEPEMDPVNRYVTLLTAKQLLDRLRRQSVEDARYETFLSGHSRQQKELQVKLNYSEELRGQFEFGSPEEKERFFRWFERMFLAEAKPQATA
jgi:hypothetical protein